ncbi:MULTISPECIES: multidrug effflux MFS transporter [unclassified Xanthobacter]|uniref:multidrug effflux MFS transporter n=1 Tax=unclassified Xanthobacter TaxID=2623496 RepID=UPI001EDF2B2B|nr:MULTISPECIES: multidrug effflux MFS transporter [unclassified Xanthobacter]
MSRAELSGTTTAGRPAPMMSELRVAVLGALMVMLGPISLAMYTPAMPALVSAFETTPAAVKLTLTVFFLGYAFSQLACGPLSDAFGRRPVALGFFSIYVLGSLAATWAPSMSWLVTGRALQGVGCAAGIAVSRALVRDQYTGQVSARIMNLIGTMLAIGPAVSPTLGGVILGAAGWHMIFVVMAAYGVILLGLLVFFVPETNIARDASLASPVGIARSYARLLGDRSFMRASLVLGGGLGGLYTLSALVPFVLIQGVGLTPTEFGLAMLAQTGSFLCGTLIAGQLLKRMSAAALVPIGLTLILCGAVGLGVGPRVLPLSTLTVMAPIGLWACGVAMVMPGCTTSALANFAQIAGAASALMGFMQIGGGFLGTAVSLLFASPLAALCTLLPAAALVALAGHLLLRPRAAQASDTAPATPVGAGPVNPADLELAADPLGVVGAAGDEIEAQTYSRSA